MNARPPISISTAPWFRPEFCAFMRSPVFLVERYLSRNLLPAVSSADHERRDVIGARKSHPILSGGQDAELPEKMPGVPEDPGMDDLAVFDLRDGARASRRAGSLEGCPSGRPDGSPSPCTVSSRSLRSGAAGQPRSADPGRQ